LSLTFCALGHELATDIGYPGSTDPLRQTWWNRAAAHNTVVVDGQNQAQSLGELEAFAVNPRFRLVQARCGNAYPLLQDYRRTLALIGDAPRCLVDVFHVVGGQTHDFCFHGQSEPELPQEKFVAEGVRLSPLPNPSATLLDLTPGAQPKTMGYDFVSALQRGTAPGPWQAEWRMGDERDVRLRLWRLPAEREEVFLGQASGHRVYPGLAKVDLGKKMNWLCCRSAGPAPWRSAFVSVVEAHAGETSQIRGVRRVAVQAPVECDAVAVVVEHADGSDLVVVSRAAGQVRVPDLGVELDGRIAAVSFDRARKPTHALLLDGAALTVGDVRVVAKSPSIAGKFAGLPQGVSEAPLVIDVEARVPDAALGAVLTLRHTNGTGSAWTVQKVEQGGPGRTRLWLDRSGREAVGLVGAIGEDGRTLLANSGFHQFEEQMRALFYNGAWLMVEGQQRRLESVALHGRGDPYLWEAKVSAPFNQPASLRGKPFIVTRVAEGDAFRIPSVTTWP
ncbi:MAG: hypothetical protein FJ279_36830, partial [Planctomycetes bacterium]|nr:hypothetical protein [Planctomycetota bacterium]